MKTIYAALALACVAVPGRSADKPLDPSITSRTVSCHEQDVIGVNAEVNYATLIQFAPNQNIVGVFWGDTDRWSVDKQNNIVLVKPSIKGTRTDIHVVTSGGDVCSFSVAEVSNDKIQADIKLHVTTPRDSNATQAFYSADQVEALKQTALSAQKALDDEKASEQKRLTSEKEAAKVEQEASLQHGYRYQQSAKLAQVFGVKSIYREGGFTFIEATPTEAPAVYEVKDGKPSLIQYEFDARTNRYRIPKLVNEGYLRVGKQKLDFAWEG